MRFSAVVFDLDGTLLDSLADIAVAANAVLVELGQPTHPVVSYNRLVGDGVVVLFQRACPAMIQDAALLQRAVDGFHRIYADGWKNRSKPYDGIEACLIRLNQAEIPLAVLSNKPDRFTKECMAHFFPKHHFMSVQGQKDEVPRKPDPAGVFAIARELAVPTELMAFVGDTNTDMETAVRGGCFAIGVSWGFRAIEELERHGAQKIVTTPTELGDFLLD